MTDELWRRKRCVHGATGECDAPYYIGGSEEPCPGGSEERLDPERVLSFPAGEFGDYGYTTGITVQDILDALASVAGTDET